MGYATAATATAVHTNPQKIMYRSIQRVLPKQRAHWVGDGFKVLPVFGDRAFTEEVSPFLMFDYAEPKSFPARALSNSDKPLGVGQHPHRGFETVTVAFQGQVEHHDNVGNHGIIGPGDVQWMTAGRGIVHEEYHSKEFTKTGGTVEMCQLWVNLRAQDKMTKPKYQSILNKDIPVVPLNNVGPNDNTDAVGEVRVIAGEMASTKGAASTFSPVGLMDVTLSKKDSMVELPIPSDHNCILFVRRGQIQVLGDEAKQKLDPQDVAILARNGASTVRLHVLENDSSVLVMSGEPIDEPIVNHGPFVMNSQEQIQAAFQDYRAGKFGK